MLRILKFIFHDIGLLIIRATILFFTSVFLVVNDKKRELAVSLICALVLHIHKVYCGWYIFISFVIVLCFCDTVKLIRDTKAWVGF